MHAHVSAVHCTCTCIVNIIRDHDLRLSQSRSSSTRASQWLIYHFHYSRHGQEAEYEFKYCAVLAQTEWHNQRSLEVTSAARLFSVVHVQRDFLLFRVMAGYSVDSGVTDLRIRDDFFICSTQNHGLRVYSVESAKCVFAVPEMVAGTVSMVEMIGRSGLLDSGWWLFPSVQERWRGGISRLCHKQDHF